MAAMHNYSDEPEPASPAKAQQPLRPYDLGRAKDGPDVGTTLAHFADRFLAQAETKVAALVDWRCRLPPTGANDQPRSRGEYIVELLTLGILRAEYAGLAAGTSSEQIARLAELWRLRSTEPSRKPEADEERGRVFLALFEQCEHVAQASNDNARDDRRLVDWLAATGEFVQEALRLRIWVDPVQDCPSLVELRQVTEELAAWFEHEARACFEHWTAGVSRFRAEVLAARRAREDLLLVTRSERLYHLNMVGAEVMNRGFRAAFEARLRRVLLVPGCMRAHGETGCKARQQGLDVTCTRCTPSCEVAALDRLGEQQGFRVFIVPHASSFSAWLAHWSKEADTALIAAACPLHLVSGGYEMRALGISAQCILLDYSGCRRHWDKVGTPTRFRHDRLLALVRR